MELISIRQVSLEYGISRQMLYYYEEMGLITSSRKNDYAYRLYDENAIKRLQQIIILRKLQIPMKQIKDILDNPTAVAVIEIFKQNIDALDEQITALSVVKSILARFVDELQEKADIRLKLDILNDKTMLAVVSSLSFSENKISKVKESLSMEELNRASETLNNLTENRVRIIHIPRMTVVEAACAKHSPSQNYYNIEFIKDPYQRIASNVRDILKKFIDDVDLFTIKPDTRIFGCGNEGPNSEGHWEGDYCMWASIPADLDVPPPLKKREFYGGLYMACTNDRFSIEDYKAGRMADIETLRMMHEWADYHDDEYSDDNGGIERPACEEFFNMFNRYGLKNSYIEEIGFSSTDTLGPIRERTGNKLSDVDKEKIVANLEETLSHGKTTDIDLSTLSIQGDFESEYKDGLLKMKCWNYHSNMSTPKNYSLPLKVELRVKVDTWIVMGFANCWVSLGWGHTGSGVLNIYDSAYEEESGRCYRKRGAIPINEFVDVEWLINRDGMAIKVNGELRHVCDDLSFMKLFRENPEYSLSAAVFIGNASGTVTVESLRVTEI